MLKVIVHYLIVVLSVAVNIVLALAVTRFIKSRYPKLIDESNSNILLICSAAFLLWAGIGKLGWSIQTFGGHTPPEKLNMVIFWILSHIGTFLLFTHIWIKTFKK